MIIGRWITSKGVRARVLATDFVVATAALGSFVSQHVCLALVALESGELATIRLDGCSLVPSEDAPSVSP